MENPQIVGQLSKQFGLSTDQAKSAMGPMLGSISKALSGNMKQEGGLEALMGSLNKSTHEAYLENPENIASQTAEQDGISVLQSLFGNKEGSREVAKAAAEKSGVDYGITKKILPLLGSLAMGAMTGQARNTGFLSQFANLLGGSSAQVENNQLSGFLRFLDTDGDGSVVDDIMRMSGKFLR